MVASILPMSFNDVVVRRRGKTLIGPVSGSVSGEKLVVVIGPTGAGKTTLLKTLHGLIKPRGGAVNWRVDWKQAVAAQSFVFQTPVMLRRSVIQNIAYPLTLRGASRADAKERAQTLAQDMGLGAMLQRPADTLSGGERQKLAIARAMVIEPQILFLDEPTSHLDGSSTHDIETILQTARARGTCLIMSTHDLGQARRLAEEIVFLKNGQIVEWSDADSFFNTPKTEDAKAFLRGDILR